MKILRWIVNWLNRFKKEKSSKREFEFFSNSKKYKTKNQKNNSINITNNLTIYNDISNLNNYYIDSEFENILNDGDDIKFE